MDQNEYFEDFDEWQTQDSSFEPETSPEQTGIEPKPDAAEVTATGTPAQTSTEPPAPVSSEAEPQATAPEGTPEGEQQDVEPMTTAQMREHMKKLEAQVNSLHRRLSKAPKATPAIKPPDPMDEASAPKIESFETIEAYDKARGQWEIDQRVNEGIRKATQGAPDFEAKEARKEFVTETITGGKEIYPDFEQIVLQPTVPITHDMIDAIREVESEKVSPADFFYYLGKNTAEAAALSRMSPVQLGRAITKIETKLEAAKASSPARKPIKTVSDAPPPIRPTDSTVIIHKDPAKMTQAEYEAWRMGGKKD